MKVSVVIPTMNRPKTLNETIEHLLSAENKPDEIIIIDQSNNNDTKDLINRMNSELFIYKHANPSLTAARNIGIKLATNDVVIMMDDDVNVQSNTIKNIKYIMSDKSISMIAANDLNSHKKKDGIAGYLFFRKKMFKSKCSYVTNTILGRLPYELKSTIETEWAMGFFFVVRKSIIEENECYWDERLELYGYPEDLDFSYRYYLISKSNKLKCIITPKVQVYHMVSTEFRHTSWKTTLMYIINREYLSYKFKKNFFDRLMIRWSNFGYFLLRLLKNDNSLDVIKAQFYCDLYRKDIKLGNLHTELYDLN